MDNELTSGSAPTPDLADLQANYNSLRQLTVWILLLLVVVTGTLCIFLLRQSRIAKEELAMVGPQATNMIAQLKPHEPLMDDLIRKFQEFGRTNPDFVPILVKYGIGPTNRPVATVPVPAKKK